MNAAALLATVALLAAAPDARLIEHSYGTTTTTVTLTAWRYSGGHMIVEYRGDGVFRAGFER